MNFVEGDSDLRARKISDDDFSAEFSNNSNNSNNLQNNFAQKPENNAQNFAQNLSNNFSQNLFVAAHELKNPLVLLRQLSFEIDSTESKNEREKLAARVKLTSERALRLVDSLTKTARLDDALFSLSPLNISQILTESVAEISPLARAKNVEISPPRISRKLPMAIGNRDFLRAILTNLLDNALDYTREKIRLSAKISGKNIEISVRDFGEIIDLNEFRHLAENLGKRAQIISNRPLSSGLGLFVAGEMSRAMRGNLSVIRHKNGGLTFSVNLPAVRQLSFLEI